MATVFKTEKGTWAYRIKIKDKSGKTIDTTGRINALGEPFKTKKEAQEAREHRISEIKSKGVKTAKTVTLSQLYEQYTKDPISKTKAYNTLLKQDSLWRNHFKENFGDMYVDEITIGHIENYLGDLYFAKEYSYAYVEGHLKMWYMLLGYAYKFSYIDDAQYNKMLINKSSRIKMPNKKIADEKGIEVYSELELNQIYDVVKGTNHELAFLIGKFCGLRIAETYALTWEDIDFREGSITINKQLIYKNGMWHFSPPKSKKSIRRIEMPEKLQSFLSEKAIEQGKQKKELGLSYRNHERIIDDRTGEIIIGADLINRKENGQIMTPNIVKYYRRLILERTAIEYRYHTLRHTHLSRLAWQGVPLVLLMQRAGHSKPDTTAKYYIGTNYYADEMMKALETL